jgi:hypothetical protein
MTNPTLLSAVLNNLPSSDEQSRILFSLKTGSPGASTAWPFVPMQVIARLTRQCGLPDAEGCVTLFALMATSRVVDVWLSDAISKQGISRLKLHSLITLLALHPKVVSQAELTELLSSNSIAVTDTLNVLIRDGLAVWHSVAGGSGARLTSDGLTFARHVMLPILGTLHNCAALLTPKERYQLAQTCTHICTNLPVCP